MVLNADKTKVMLRTSKQKRKCLQNPTLARYNVIDITMTTCDKILDIQRDKNLMWNGQCQQVYKKYPYIYGS